MEHKGKAYITETHLLFERVAWLLLAAAFAVCVYGAVTIKGDFPIHFDIYGSPDGYGSPLTMLLFPTVMLGVLVLISVIVRRVPPEKMNMPFTLKAENTNAVMVQVWRLLFLLEDEIAAFTLVQSLLWVSETAVSWFALAFAALAILTVIIGTIRMVKANKEEIQKKC